MPFNAASSPSPVSERLSAGVAGLLLKAAQEHPTSGLHFLSREPKADERFLSYPALLEEARSMAAKLQSWAGQPGAKVALLLERPRDFIPAFWACILGGYVPCPLALTRSDADRWQKHIAHVNALLDHPLFVTTGDLKRDLPATVVVAEVRELRGKSRDDAARPTRLDDPAVLMLTSGSTGNAKAVVLTHANLLASMEAKAERQALSADDITLNWISFDHVAALLETHMLPVCVGATQLHVDPTLILEDPLLLLRLIDQYRISMTFSPNFLLAQINAALRAGTSGASPPTPFTADLSCLKVLVSGGEAIVVETGLNYLSLLAPYGLRRDSLWPAFGMTETCAGSIYSREFPDGDSAREFASLGLPVKGLQIRIADDRENVLPDGQPGELQLRGPMIFSHYLNNHAATAAAFTSDGWFRSGDVGCLEQGRLRLVGRNKDSIIVNGVNYFSHELEATLEQLSGVEPAFVAAFPTRPKDADTEQLVVMFATSLSECDEDELYQLIVAIRNTTIMLWGFRPSLILPVPKSAFPKTSLGKIQRGLLRRRLEAGEFADPLTNIEAVVTRKLGAYTPPTGDVETALAKVFARILGAEVASISATVNFFDLGGTSLDTLKLTQVLEKQFGLRPALPIALQNPTVRMLAGRVASASSPEPRVYDPIVPLQLTGKKTPLFCVHPGNGEILILVNLAKYFINERPFYALRPRGFNRGEECFSSFDEMVETYIDAIFKRQPHGPYALAGYSLGGPIAFEIAKRMQARGERVEFLGCIDTHPCIKEPAHDLTFIATALAGLLGLVDLKVSEQMNEELRAAQAHRDPCEYIMASASPERLAELDLDGKKYAAWVRVALAVENLMRGHVTLGKVKAMSIFQSVGFPMFGIDAQDWRGRIRRWDGFVEEPKYIDVPGDHYTLMAPKHVAAFQAVLRAELARTLNGK